jgi:hypothetical protein
MKDKFIISSNAEIFARKSEKPYDLLVDNLANAIEKQVKK